jgi:hypothetical protein
VQGLIDPYGYQWQSQVGALCPTAADCPASRLDLEEAAMSRARDLLYRFRPAGAPGAASAAGVPVDRNTELAAEFGELFGRLDETERGCAEIRDRARNDAAEIQARYAERARSVVAAASQRADAERAGAAAVVREGAEADGAKDVAAAEQAAAALRERAARRMAAYVERLASLACGSIDDGEGRPADMELESR